MNASIYTGDERILWGVVANAGRLSQRKAPRWAHVHEATGLGSTRSSGLCRRFGFDPDEAVGSEKEACESGQPECGSVTRHDSEGVPLCDVCWNGLLDDSAQQSGVVSDA